MNPLNLPSALQPSCADWWL